MPNVEPSAATAKPYSLDANPPVGPRADHARVNVSILDAPPDAPPNEEVEAAFFHSAAEAQAAADALVVAGVPRDTIVVLNDTKAEETFLKQYIHLDSDRHQHGGVAPVFFALIGAFVIGLLTVGAVSSFGFGLAGTLLSAVAGAAFGAVTGGIAAGFAFRQADDKSVEMIENYSAEGHLVAVRRPFGTSGVDLSEIGRNLARHGGTAMRLRPHLHKADLHPGDARPSKEPTV